MPKNDDTLGLAQPHLVALEPYEPIEPVSVMAEQLGLPEAEIVKLDGNENPYGPSSAVQEALARYPYYHIYPDPEQRRLREALANYLRLNADQIVAGSGADELLDLIGRAFISADDAVVNAPPTFGMYPLITRLHGGCVVAVPRSEEFSFDIEGALAAIDDGARLVFLASPNNPTGNCLPRRDLDRLLSSNALIVVDEAYVEFSGAGGVASLVSKHNNLIVLRTFSKWAGLAGLRVGYGIFPKAVAGLIRKIKLPYNLNVAAEAAALASLEDVSALKQRVDAIVSERERLYQRLTVIPWLTPRHSEANFFLCGVEKLKAKEVWAQLRKRGILVRHFETPELRTYLRISVGKPEHSQRLLVALDEIGESLD